MTAKGFYKMLGCRKRISPWRTAGFSVIILLVGLGTAGVCHGDGVPLHRPDPASSSVLTLHSAVTVIGNRVFLTDVIESGSTAHLPAGAGRRVLMNAPAPGKDKLLPGKWVASVIRAKGGLPDSVGITAPDQILVRRACQTLAMARLEDFLYGYVARRIGDPEFKITRMKMRGTDRFPVGRLTLQVLEPEPRRITGRINLRVRVKVKGEKFGWLTLSGWVDRFETVVCASRYLCRGTVLTPDDLAHERMNTSRMPAGVIRDLNDAVGKELKRKLAPGNYLRQNMLSVPPLIQKGDKVKLVARSGNINIVTFGIAKNAGGAGEQIRIENMTSKKIIMGRIRDASTVDAIF